MPAARLLGLPLLRLTCIRALVVLTAAGLTACSWFRETPKVNPRGLSLQSLSFESMDLAFLYGLENPFPVSLPSGRAHAALVVAGEKVVETSAEIPHAGGSTTAEGRFDMTVRFLQILKAVGSALQSTIPVVISGSCRIEIPNLVRWVRGPDQVDIPLQWEGSIPALLPSFRGFVFHPSLFGPSRAGLKIGNDGPSAIELEKAAAKVKFEDEIVFQGDVVIPHSTPGREREMEMNLDMSPAKMGTSAQKAFTSRRAQFEFEGEAWVRVNGMAQSVPLRMQKAISVAW